MQKKPAARQDRHICKIFYSLFKQKHTAPLRVLLFHKVNKQTIDSPPVQNYPASARRALFESYYRNSVVHRHITVGLKFSKKSKVFKCDNQFTNKRIKEV